MVFPFGGLGFFELVVEAGVEARMPFPRSRGKDASPTGVEAGMPLLQAIGAGMPLLQG